MDHPEISYSLKRKRDEDDIFMLFKRAKSEMENVKDQKDDIIATTIINTLQNNPEYQLITTTYKPAKYIISNDNNVQWYVKRELPLGVGSFGEVTDAYTDLNGSYKYVAKRIRYREFFYGSRISRESFYKNVNLEIELQQLAYKAHVALPIHAAWFSNADKSAIIVMQKADDEVLTHLSNMKWTNDAIQRARTEITQLVDKLHSLGILHNDLGDRNIMYIKDEDRFVLIDFGLSQRFDVDGPNASLIIKQDNDKIKGLFNNIKEIKEEEEKEARHIKSQTLPNQ